MDWNQVEGNWKQVRGNVKKQWGKLTDDDLTAIDGRREILEGRIQERYGYTKDRVRKEIEEWQRSFASQLNRSSDELADQIDSIRADIQSLTSTVSRMANKQINRAQDRAVETANQAEEAIRQNPLSGWPSPWPRLPVRRLHASIGEDTCRANRACLIPVKVAPRIRTCQEDPTGKTRAGKGCSVRAQPARSDSGSRRCPRTQT